MSILIGKTTGSVVFPGLYTANAGNVRKLLRYYINKILVNAKKLVGRDPQPNFDVDNDDTGAAKVVLVRLFGTLIEEIYNNSAMGKDFLVNAGLEEATQAAFRSRRYKGSLPTPIANLMMHLLPTDVNMSTNCPRRDCFIMNDAPGGAGNANERLRAFVGYNTIATANHDRLFTYLGDAFGTTEMPSGQTGTGGFLLGITNFGNHGDANPQNFIFSEISKVYCIARPDLYTLKSAVLTRLFPLNVYIARLPQPDEAIPANAAAYFGDNHNSAYMHVVAEVSTSHMVEESMASLATAPAPAPPSSKPRARSRSPVTAGPPPKLHDQPADAGVTEASGAGKDSSKGKGHGKDRY
jgi:hypothetical protein